MQKFIARVDLRLLFSSSGNSQTPKSSESGGLSSWLTFIEIFILMSLLLHKGGVSAYLKPFVSKKYAISTIKRVQFDLLKTKLFIFRIILWNFSF